jgi:acetyl-CoA acyltransferase
LAPAGLPNRLGEVEEFGFAQGGQAGRGIGPQLLRKRSHRRLRAHVAGILPGGEDGRQYHALRKLAIMSAAYVIDAVRSPFGRYGGGLSHIRPDDLAAHAVGALLERAPQLEPARVDDVLFGDANQAGEDNRNVARMAWLLNGLPTSVPGATINRLCGSSLDAAMQASRMIEAGDASIVLVGGVESMSRAPWILLKTERSFPREHQELHSSTLGWRMVNPKMPEQWTISLGQSAEKLAGIYSISRQAQDEFALRSHQRAIAGWESGFYGQWVVPVPGTELERDENMRPDTSLERLAKLKPSFVEGGTVTAGNSSPLNDGVGAMLIADEAGAQAIGKEPLARFVSRGAAAVDPDVFGIAPVEASEAALHRAGIGWEDVAVVELNEAFASQSLADIGQWKGLDPENVNPHGGAIALGHPLGASGVRILGGLAHELKRRGGGYGVATLCIGVGQGLAVVLEAT